METGENLDVAISNSKEQRVGKTSQQHTPYAFVDIRKLERVIRHASNRRTDRHNKARAEALRSAFVPINSVDDVGFGRVGKDDARH